VYKERLGSPSWRFKNRWILSPTSFSIACHFWKGNRKESLCPRIHYQKKTKETQRKREEKGEGGRRWACGMGKWGSPSPRSPKGKNFSWWKPRLPKESRESSASPPARSSFNKNQSGWRMSPDGGGGGEKVGFHLHRKKCATKMREVRFHSVSSLLADHFLPILKRINWLIESSSIPLRWFTITL